MATYTSANFPGAFNAADAYGVPQELLDAVVDCNSIVDLFPWHFNNQPVEAPEMLVQAEGLTGDGSFAEGGCPDEVTWGDAKFAYSAKSFGRQTPRVSYVSMAAKQHTYRTSRTIVTAKGPVTVTDEWEYMLYIVLKALRRVQEWLIVRGDSTANALNYDGFDRIIRAPVAGRLDINGVGQTIANSVVHSMAGALTLTKMREMITVLLANGTDLGEIKLLMRPAMFVQLAGLIAANYFDPGAQLEKLMGQGWIPLYGANIPVYTSDCVAASGSPNAYTSTMYFLAFNYYGIPSLWFDYFDFSNIVRNSDLFYGEPAGGIAPSPFVMVGKDKGSAYCTSTAFALWAHGKMVSIAPQSLGKLTDISYTFQFTEAQVSQP